MISHLTPAGNYTDSPAREVLYVLVATCEHDAFEEANRIRRQLPRGAGWKVRTNKRSIKSDGIKIDVWAVTAWRPKEARVPSMSDPINDPSSDLN